MDEQDARARFGRAPVARLATVTTDLAPHLVPCTFAAIGDVVVTAVDDKPKRSTRLARLANIAANPRVALLVDHYTDDWSTLWWVRADGEATIVPGGARHASAVEALVGRYPQYAARPPSGPVIWVEVRRWSGWAAAGGPATR